MGVGPRHLQTRVRETDRRPQGGGSDDCRARRRVAAAGRIGWGIHRKGCASESARGRVGRLREDRAERADASKKPDTKSDEKAKRNAAAALEKEKRDAAAALEKEQKRQALDRAKAEAERERAKKQREQMIAKADAAFERARSRHDDAMDTIRQRREELDKDEAREDERWEREQQAHEDALKEAKA